MRKGVCCAGGGTCTHTLQTVVRDVVVGIGDNVRVPYIALNSERGTVGGRVQARWQVVPSFL